MSSANDERLVAARRHLLAHPMVSAQTDPRWWRECDALYEPLRRWFNDRLGWTLLRDRQSRLVRLAKTTPEPRPIAPSTTVTSLPTMNPRRYALAFAVAAVLSDGDRDVLTVTALRDDLVDRLDADPLLPSLDLADRAADRDSLYAAVRWLEATGIVSVRDGDLQSLRDEPDRETRALLEVNHAALRSLLTVTGSPAAAQRPEDLVVEPVFEGEQSRRDQVRRRLLRRLADNPAVYYDELPAEERAWLTSDGRTSGALVRFADDLGFVLEWRIEGVAAIDANETQPVARRKFPAAGSTATHAALLLAEHLADLSRTAGLLRPVGRDVLLARLQDLAADVGGPARWADWVSSDGGVERLYGEVVEVLVDFDLVVDHGDAVTPRPLIGRFGAEPVREISEGSGRQTAFADETGGG